jgi:DNA-binding protein HU-beta
MKKSALLRKVSADTGVPYSTVKKVMDSALEHISDSLSDGDRVVLSGFGTFALRPYRARQWVNPQTGRQIDIPAALRPGFITSAALKRRLTGAPLAAADTEEGSDGLASDAVSASEPAASAPRKARQPRAAKRTAAPVESTV